jgi:hypothetical protein
MAKEILRFDQIWQVAQEAQGQPAPIAEYYFIEGRKHAFDFAWPEYMVAIEIDGGQHKFGGGRHNTDEDRWKINEAHALGWLVFHISHTMLANDPWATVTQVVRALKLRMPHEQENISSWQR